MAGTPDLPQVLLGLARDDEFAARSLLPVAGVADSILGFHCQQAVEKSLKAAIASRGVEFPYTHDLAGLLELCERSGLKVPGALDGVDRLAPYGVHMRYGTSHGSGLDRDQALRWAATAIEWVAALVEPEGD
ncbi:MAG: HEPN domain-containing protein [Solirubrobacterales bacterium]|nr:HEPN domain-containing protein [Solirubrobacterales bacterium]